MLLGMKPLAPFRSGRREDAATSRAGFPAATLAPFPKATLSILDPPAWDATASRQGPFMVSLVCWAICARTGLSMALRASTAPRNKDEDVALGWILTDQSQVMAAAPSTLSVTDVVATPTAPPNSPGARTITSARTFGAVPPFG